MSALIEHSNAPKNTSLAVFKPSAIRRLLVEEDEREWKEEWLRQLQQVDMFTIGRSQARQRVPIDKIPYKFKYEFEDDSGRVSSMAIEDWEIGALYRNCLASAEGDEAIAVEKVRQKYGVEFLNDRDVSLFLGTTLGHHRARHINPFTIIGVFYPPRQLQKDLF